MKKKGGESSSSKRLLFDRRYGWIYDDWKQPSDVSLAGGRGLFCVLPLGLAAFHMASQSIKRIGSSAVKIIEKPELVSPQALGANLNDQMQKLISSVQEPGFNLFSLNIAKKPTSHSDIEIKEAQAST